MSCDHADPFTIGAKGSSPSHAENNETIVELRVELLNLTFGTRDTSPNGGQRLGVREALMAIDVR